MLLPIFRSAAVVFLVIALARCAAAEEASAVTSARASIQAEDLKRHVDVLANDTLEGREAGSRGGRAAGIYLGREFQRLKLAGAGTQGGYYQLFGAQYSNLLGVLEGSDPQLKKQYVLVGAHYDHVGYGNSSNSFGPFGYIHNGADDNASGTAGLLELAEAMAQLEPRPKRSVLFVLWDGEEKGLLGSKHWLSQPTIPADRIALSINMDMIGRLRNRQIDVLGSRTGFGLRRLVSEQNAGIDLLLNFTWEIKEDSDHYPFYARGIPIVMLFTGLHDDYHRPSDDPEKLNTAGMQDVVRLLFGIALESANRSELPKFRPASRSESPAMQRMAERPLPAWPGRLGLAWDPGDQAAVGLRVNRVVRGSAAERGGLRAGDVLLRMAGEEVRHKDDFPSLVLAASNPVEVELIRDGAKEPTKLKFQLDGPPVRVGISSRFDNAEPDVAILNRVVSYSPAEQAGLRLGDRIYRVNGQSFVGSDQFQHLLAADHLEMLVERRGQLRTIVVEPKLLGK